jgi:hypothetical protein
MPPRIPHIFVTSIEDFVEKMKKPENHESFYAEIIRAQKETKRLKAKDLRRRARKANDGSGSGTDGAETTQVVEA